MEYFCYISRSKVDQLYASLSPGAPDEWTEQRTTEQKIDADAHADWNIARIINLFKGGITYGRKGVIQREQKIKVQYVEKLGVVLAAIAKERPVPAFEQAISTGFSGSLYFHHSGDFKISEPIKTASTSDVVTLRTSVDGVRLSLDCSLRFFSEGSNEPDGGFSPNSSNSRFFSGSIPLAMETLFVLLHKTAKEVIGTPLYLKLGGTADPYL